MDGKAVDVQDAFDIQDLLFAEESRQGGVSGVQVRGRARGSGRRDVQVTATAGQRSERRSVLPPGLSDPV